MAGWGSLPRTSKVLALAPSARLRDACRRPAKTAVQWPRSWKPQAQTRHPRSAPAGDRSMTARMSAADPSAGLGWRRAHLPTHPRPSRPRRVPPNPRRDVHRGCVGSSRETGAGAGAGRPGAPALRALDPHALRVPAEGNTRGEGELPGKSSAEHGLRLSRWLSPGLGTLLEARSSQEAAHRTSLHRSWVLLGVC